VSRWIRALVFVATLMVLFVVVVLFIGDVKRWS
jgi:hypothetical protein